MLGRNWGVARATFKKLVTGADKNFTTGIIGHGRARNFWEPTSNNTGSNKNFDVYEMLGRFYQKEVKIWDKACKNEKDCGLWTQKAYNAKMQKRLKTLSSAYKGKNDRLYRNYNFFAVKYQRSSNITTRIYNQNYNYLRYVWVSRFQYYVKASVLRPPTN